MVMESISLGCTSYLCSTGIKQNREPVKIAKKLGKGHVLCFPDVIPFLSLGELNEATCIKTFLVI